VEGGSDVVPGCLPPSGCPPSGAPRMTLWPQNAGQRPRTGRSTALATTSSTLISVSQWNRSDDSWRQITETVSRLLVGRMPHISQLNWSRWFLLRSIFKNKKIYRTVFWRQNIRQHFMGVKKHMRRSFVLTRLLIQYFLAFQKKTLLNLKAHLFHQILKWKMFISFS
jgi:hypothetical protein